ncbi:MAG: hypothetical protein ACE5HI_16135 [bacterium]
MGKSVLQLKDAKVDVRLLSGTLEGEKVEIPLDDIASIEVIRFDKRKIIIESSIFVIVATLGVLYLKGFSEALKD